MDFKYFELTKEVEPKVVGVRDGSGQAYLDEGILARHSQFREVFYRNDSWTKDWWKRWTYWREYGESLSEIPMKKHAKHTDFINVGGVLRGFFVSGRVREILETARLPNHQFFPVTFTQNSKLVEGYWWFCFDKETGEHTVNFTKSEFDFEKHQQKFGKWFTVASYADYMNVFYETGSALKATKLVFNSTFEQELDIWGTQFLTSQSYVSKRLLNKLVKADINGYRAEYPLWNLVFE